MLSFYLPYFAVFYLYFLYCYATLSFANLVLSPDLLSFNFFQMLILYLIKEKSMQNCCKIVAKMQSCCNFTTKILQKHCKAEQSHYNFETKFCDYRTLGFNNLNIVELKLSIDSMYSFFLFFYFSNFRELWS